MRVGFLGPRATFTHLAVQSYFGEEIEQIAYSTIPQCIDAVAEGEIDLAVVPTENALEGSVNLTIDYLIHEQPLYIVGEIVSPIEQHFMVHPANKEAWRSVSRVYSHSHAIAQCHKFLHKSFKGITYDYATSTGAAAQYVKNNPEELVAAIANKLAAKEYGLEIVQPNIHDYHYNHTRFAIVHPTVDGKFPSKKLTAEKEKTTLMVTLPSDQSGALHQVLSAFTWRKLNLSKIESRPMKTGLGNYFFIIDIDMRVDEVLIPGSIAELEALGCGVKLLGTYEAYFIRQEIEEGV
ncbi:prephenate dehydratase [Metabacillus halosaccharovorans]|uniref:Prephenate dehydratase n=1 Tax=Metabacillus halosaccharovorans TaxID=930124 RepID=A0ABT3DEE8_9BACI|nr:prephenate dehydratase [Metabacillus halosaccharovorans]MCV9885233.1 prephenate dehydratase [Metabacillus halosaccharovorans]